MMSAPAVWQMPAMSIKAAMVPALLVATVTTGFLVLGDSVAGGAWRLRTLWAWPFFLVLANVAGRVSITIEVLNGRLWVKNLSRKAVCEISTIRGVNLTRDQEEGTFDLMVELSDERRRIAEGHSKEDLERIGKQLAAFVGVPFASALKVLFSKLTSQTSAELRSYDFGGISKLGSEKVAVWVVSS